MLFYELRKFLHSLENCEEALQSLKKLEKFISIRRFKESKAD